MLVHYTKIQRAFHRSVSGLLLAAVLFGMFPVGVFAEDGIENGGENSGVATEETSTSTDPLPSGTGEGDGNTGTSTESGTDNGSGTTTESGSEHATTTATSTDQGVNALDGEEGEAGDGTDSATSTATSTDDGTATSTPGTDGTEGSDGGAGDGGEGVAEGEDEGLPIPIVSESDIGEDATPDDGEGITGDVVRTGRNVTIATGEAVAQGEIANDVNNNLVLSEVEVVNADFDTYTFNATGTNEALVTNDGGAFALTGDNVALSTGVAEIETGAAIAAFNIANVINSNVINSNGFLYLKNQVLDPDTSLDLTDFFFPDQSSLLAGADDCTLLSCRAEDIVYNFSQTNTATVTNDAYLEAITGDNVAEGDLMQVTTGDAYGGANVINVVNTNIVDSNYRLLTLNAMGDLDGDLVLPTESLFKAFFGQPNGMMHAINQREDVQMNIDNTNEAQVNNNVETYAETGMNQADTSYDSIIVTGRAESESNILNKINQNVYGGDSFYLLIRVHGTWTGDVYGLPAGLTWMWTSDGILIYNEDAEIEPSALIPYDVDSYAANVTDMNDVVINNNINIDAITGRNEVGGIAGGISTGNAFASANVMNIANTNIIGTNFSMAVINIFGDFDGDVSFSATDLALSGSVVAGDSPVAKGTELIYTYQIENVSDETATGVTLRQTLSKAYAGGTNNQQSVSVGTLTPGQKKTVTLYATVRDDLVAGTHSIVATATVDSNEADENIGDNVSLLQMAVEIPGTEGSDTGTTTDGGTGTSTNDGTDDSGPGTTTDDGTSTEDQSTDTSGGDTTNTEETTSNTQPSSGGSSPSPGGGRSSKTKSIEREEEPVDPSKPPHIIVEKFADVDEDRVVTAGEEVDYTIVVTNKGGNAYDAEVFDTLTNPIGSVVSEQSWELGTILPGEVIKLTYTTAYALNTPTGKYKNTASVVAYRAEDGKKSGADPLKVDDAVHSVTIRGVDLAVGNVGVIAFFPGAAGQTSALLVWETSKSSVSQIFYGPKGTVFNKDAFNYGFPFASFMFEEPKERHAMIITGLQPGTTYAYRIDAHSGTYDAISREYEIAVPYGVQRLTLNLPTGYYPALSTSPYYTSTPGQAPAVAGASTYVPPQTAAQPTPSVVSGAPKPEVVEKSVPQNEETKETVRKEDTGLFGKAKSALFGLFR